MVGPGAALERIVAIPAFERIVSGAADKQVVGIVAEQAVVSGAADHVLDHRAGFDRQRATIDQTGHLRSQVNEKVRIQRGEIENVDAAVIVGKQAAAGIVDIGKLVREHIDVIGIIVAGDVQAPAVELAGITAGLIIDSKLPLPGRVLSPEIVGRKDKIDVVGGVSGAARTISQNGLGAVR